MVMALRLGNLNTNPQWETSRVRISSPSSLFVSCLFLFLLYTLRLFLSYHRVPFSNTLISVTWSSRSSAPTGRMAIPVISMYTSQFPISLHILLIMSVKLTQIPESTTSSQCASMKNTIEYRPHQNPVSSR